MNKSKKISVQKSKKTKKKTVKKKAVTGSSKKKVAKKKLEKNQVSTKKKTTKRKKGAAGGAHGGKRNGSGRKKGASTKKTRKIADKLAADGELTPLEYMLEAMRETPAKIKAQFKAGEIDQTEYAVKLMGLMKRRDAAAEKAAPYMHPRLSSIDANINPEGHEAYLALLAEADAAAS